MAHHTLHSSISYPTFLNAFLSTLYIASYRQSNETHLVSVLDKAMMRVSKNIAALTKNTFLNNPNKNYESSEDDFVPSEELER